jgi:sporulation protein YlmC with PRC-barrel domain
MKMMKLAVIAFLATGSTLAIARAASAADNAPPDANLTTSLMQKVTDNLLQSGYNNVEVMPGSFLVRATDKSGDPVSMYITPDSMTAVSDIAMTTHPLPYGAQQPAAQVSDTSDAQPHATNVAAFSSSDNAQNAFRTIPAGDELGTKVIGLDVHNADNKSIGTIKDVAFNQDGRVNGYILSVGGFLGIDEHDVAVRPSAVDLTWNNSDKKWHAEMDVTAAQLKAAPEYKYSS